MGKKKYRKIKERGKKEKWLINYFNSIVEELKDKAVWDPFQPFCRV